MKLIYCEWHACENHRKKKFRMGLEPNKVIDVFGLDSAEPYFWLFGTRFTLHSAESLSCLHFPSVALVCIHSSPSSMPLFPSFLRIHLQHFSATLRLCCTHEPNHFRPVPLSRRTDWSDFPPLSPLVPASPSKLPSGRVDSVERINK